MKEISFIVRDEDAQLFVDLLESRGQKVHTKNLKLRLNEVRLYNILKHVCAFRDVEISHVISKSRKKEFVEPRQMFSYVVKHVYPRVPFKIIGDFLGGRDHSTILHSCQVIDDVITNKAQPHESKQMKNDIDNLILYVNNM